MSERTPDKKGSTFKALPVSPPPIWNGLVIISADCCVNGELIKAGTLMQVGPIPTTFFPARTFSDFIRNATEEEKREVYDEVMKHASARQLRCHSGKQCEWTPSGCLHRLRGECKEKGAKHG